LAKKHNTTRQNLTKHFESNLCKSPSDFKKIQRFREALKSQINSQTKNNLTSLSYDMLFYDQSHLIKDFKSLTGLTPKKFFKNISSQENGEVNWLFV
jgi:AraC-like DNA-binding protein